MAKHLTNLTTRRSQALLPPPCQHYSFKKGGEGPGHRLPLKVPKEKPDVQVIVRTYHQLKLLILS